MMNHSDVVEDEGWIVIPLGKLPDDWRDASDIRQLQSLGRSFVFPGEHIHLLLCLSASKQDIHTINPIKVSNVISKTEENGETKTAPAICLEEENTSTSKSLQMEDHKWIESLLERFQNSNFFVRIAELDEPLWSKRNVSDASSSNLFNVVIDRGGFAGNTSGGLARNAIGCYSLRNGDLVVILQVNVAINNIQDPVLEVLQFEKHETAQTAEKLNELQLNHEDPYRGLLEWLLPLDRTLPPPRPLSPSINSPSVSGGVTQRSTSVSSSSPIFSHFRSYSMSSLPQTSMPPSYSKSSSDLENYGRFSQEKVLGHDIRNAGLLSFRGVSLEPERFSVHCGLEGIYLPGKRWRKKIEIVQPIEIRSFSAECITEDLLCVQVKNVAPANLPDIIIYLEEIAIVFEESSQGGLPIFLPIASIETGNDHSIPNLALRRGEEHSFILKPASTVGRDLKGNGENKPMQTHQKTYPSTPNRLSISTNRFSTSASNKPSISRLSTSTSKWLSASRLSASSPIKNSTPRADDVRTVFPSTSQYSIVVSCRCNYAESKLFFKQPTSWRPHVARDLMISVTPQISEQTVGRASQFPVQVLTLQASNLTSEDLTLTILAPIESNSSTLAVPLSSTSVVPRTPLRLPPDNHRGCSDNEKSSTYFGRTGATSEVVSSSESGSTHLWLQSTVPLGCVPAGSSTTAKLELLPLTNGIITLGTLEVAIKEKGMTYRPEQQLKVRAMSSVSTGIP